MGAAEKRLAHMRNVEQAGLLAGVKMFLENARRILHRHGIARERHQLSAQLQMERVERCLLQCFVGLAHPVLKEEVLPHARRGASTPLSWDLRDFPRPPSKRGAGITPSVGA